MPSEPTSASRWAARPGTPSTRRSSTRSPRTTIAHGYLTLSLAPALLDEIVSLEGCELVINVGLDRLRFVSPVPAGSRVRLHAELSGLEQALDGGLQAMLALRFELEGSERPCCVADVLFRYYAEPPAEQSSEDSVGRVQPPPPWESWQDCCSEADRLWARYVRDTVALWASIARQPPLAEGPLSLPLRAWAIGARLAAELAAAVPKSPSG
jgi:MaoC like domain